MCVQQTMVQHSKQLHKFYRQTKTLIEDLFRNSTLSNTLSPYNSARFSLKKLNKKERKSELVLIKYLEALLSM